uniref:C-type lectin domain-containing protein n=1 Tax=Lepisosteus oculatus TaxID=7918 RepID=W5N6P0_LEPOC
MNTEDCTQFKTYYNTSRDPHQPNPVLQNTEDASSATSKIRCQRQACVCLTVLCCLLLGGYAIFSVFFYQITEEKDTRHAAILLNLSSVETDFADLKDNYTAVLSALLMLQKNYSDLLNKTRKVEGWQPFMSSCYFLSSDEMTWEESSTNCSRMGGHLVMIETQTEQEFLTKSSGSSHTWIGLSDLAVEGDWRWINGLHPTQRFWFSHEPDDWKGEDRKGEDCAHLKPLTHPLNNWHDAPCTKKYHRICERKRC